MGKGEAGGRGEGRGRKKGRPLGSPERLVSSQFTVIAASHLGRTNAWAAIHWSAVFFWIVAMPWVAATR